MKRFMLLFFLLLPLALAAQKPPSTATPKSTTRRHINLPLPPWCSNASKRAYCQAPYSDAVQVGNTLYLAGSGGWDPQTGKPPADFEQEARLALDGIKQTLAAAGMSMDDLVYVQVFCSDISLWERFNAVYRTYFREKELPARAFIGVNLVGGSHIEIVSIAVKE